MTGQIFVIDFCSVLTGTRNQQSCLQCLQRLVRNRPHTTQAFLPQPVTKCQAPPSQRERERDEHRPAGVKTQKRHGDSKQASKQAVESSLTEAMGKCQTASMERIQIRN